MLFTVSKKCRVAVLFQNSTLFLLFCFQGGAYIGLLYDGSQNTYKGFYLWKVTITDQILHFTTFMKIAEYEKYEKEQIAVKSLSLHITIRADIVRSA